MKVDAQSLFECAVSKGDLVLLVNESYDISGQKIARESPSIVYTHFDRFSDINGGMRPDQCFFGEDPKYIEEPQVLPNGQAVANIRNESPTGYIGCAADRIYVGQDSVEWALNNDPAILERINPE